MGQNGADENRTTAQHHHPRVVEPPQIKKALSEPQGHGDEKQGANGSAERDALVCANLGVGRFDYRDNEGLGCNDGSKPEERRNGCVNVPQVHRQGMDEHAPKANHHQQQLKHQHSKLLWRMSLKERGSSSSSKRDSERKRRSLKGQ